MKKIIQVESLELFCRDVLNVDSFQKLSELRSRNDFLIETNQEFILLKAGVAFRTLKADARPKILKALEIYVNPDRADVRVVMSVQDLLAFALKRDIVVIETADQFVIPSDILLTAKRIQRGDLSYGNWSKNDREDNGQTRGWNLERRR